MDKPVVEAERENQGEDLSHFQWNITNSVRVQGATIFVSETVKVSQRNDVSILVKTLLSS